MFTDRRSAGQTLGPKLHAYANRADAIVLGLPRGGVPVAFEVARVLGVPLDVFTVRKLGVPGHDELAMGAIASGNIRVLNEETIAAFSISLESLAAVQAREMLELDRRERRYRDGRPLPTLSGRVAILVDDGLATGASMRAAIRALRARAPAGVVVAVPVAAAQICRELAREADDIICAHTPRRLISVGHWYRRFSQTSDDEVYALLALGRCSANAR